MQNFKSSLHVLISLMVLYGCQFSVLKAQQQDEKLSRFLEIGEQLRQKAGIPGVGIAIVHKGEILYAGGLGYSNIKAQTPVTENSLFSIGSNTKAFTGLLATKLVSRGLLKWNEPLKNYIPELELQEPYVTKHVTLIDALAHRVGLKRSREVWRNKGLTRSQVLAKLKDVEFDSSFRSKYNYNNLMYVVAGIAAERVTGDTWERLIQTEIFDPLGMQDSYTTMEDFLESENRTIGYHNDGIRAAPPVDLTSIAPAGAISSTPKDIAIWVKMLVNNGVHESRPFLTKQEYDYMLRPHADLSIRNGDELWYYYTGLGGYSKNGRRTVGADGAIDGQNSRCVLLLDEGFGIFVMTNKVSDYKTLLADYAKQIFVRGNYKKNAEKELVLARRASFDIFATRLLDDSIESAKKTYEQRQYKPAEEWMNQLGYQLIANKQSEKAVFVLKLNVLSFPNSSNAHDSLGEAYLSIKNLELAQKHYEKSLSLDPQNDNAAKMIVKIKDLKKESS